MPTDQGRVDAPHEGIIDLKITEGVDPFPLHEIERPAAVEGPQRTTVTVGRECERTRGLEHNFSVQTHRRHPSLAEKMHPRGIETKARVVREEYFRRRMIRMTRHDKPMQRSLVTQTRRADFFGENVEERFPFQRGNGKGPLWSVVAEPRPLSARHRKRRDPPAAQRELPRRFRLRPRLCIAAVFRSLFVGRGSEARQVNTRRALTLCNQRTVELAHLREVYLRRIGEELGLFNRREPVKKGEDVRLTGALKKFDDGMLGHAAAGVV